MNGLLHLLDAIGNTVAAMQRALDQKDARIAELEAEVHRLEVLHPLGQEA